MKKISKIVLSLVVLAGLWSCEGEDNFMFTEPKAASFAILTPDSGSSVILTEAAPQSNTALAFTWEDMEYTTPTAVTYTVQVAKNGTDFAEPTTLSSSGLQNYSITVGALNNLIHTLYGDELVEPEEGETPAAVALDVRIVSSVGTTGSQEAYSNVISVVVTPFFSTVIEIKQLYLVGNATSAGWNNNDNNIPLFRDPANPYKFYYTGYFLNDGTENAGQFKLLEKKTFWQPQYGGADGVLAVNDGTGSDPAAFSVPASGYYSFEVDIDEMTYSLVPYEGTVPAAISTMGTVGSARTGGEDGWNNDDDMVSYTFDAHIWRVNNYSLFDGELKFRANDGWDQNWGANTAISGMGTPGGPNIPVTAGVYDIYFNDLDGRYIFIPVE